MKQFLSACFACLILMAPFAHAYETDIRAAPDEVFTAALKALSPYGIEKQDAVKYSIETDWISAESARKRSFLGIGLSRKYLKKSKIYFQLTQTERFTHILITSRHLFKTPDAAPLATWKTLKPSHSDTAIEKEVFRAILAAMEDLRRKN